MWSVFYSKNWKFCFTEFQSKIEATEWALKNKEKFDFGHYTID